MANFNLDTCPHCGGAARVNKGDCSPAGYRVKYIMCTKCLCRTRAIPIDAPYKEIVNEWNRRAACVPKHKAGPNKKKRKYFRKCGVCGERHEQSEMIRTDQSPNGWICFDCHEEG